MKHLLHALLSSLPWLGAQRSVRPSRHSSHHWPRLKWSADPEPQPLAPPSLTTFLDELPPDVEAAVNKYVIGESADHR